MLTHLAPINRLTKQMLLLHNRTTLLFHGADRTLRSLKLSAVEPQAQLAPDYTDSVIIDFESLQSVSPVT